MAGSVNKVILVGRVGQDPETKNIGRGQDFEIAEFSLATSKTWRDKSSGERKEKTEWHKIKVMNDRLVKGIIRPYVKKGSQLYIEGELETESWEDRNGGGKRYATKIIIGPFGGTLEMLNGNGNGDRDDDRRDDRGSRSQGGGQRQSDGSGSGGGFNSDLDDEIPF